MGGMEVEENDSKVTYKKVEIYVNQQIDYIKKMPENKRKSILAELRHGIGKNFEENPDCWGSVFMNMPDNMLGNGKNPSPEENAVYHSLTLFALHQQGKEITSDCMHTEKEGMGFGMSLSKLLSGNEEADRRVEKKFKILVSSKNIDEMAYYLRRTIPILSKEGISVNYGMLAANLYDYQFDERRMFVFLKWGRQFYSALNRKNREENEEA